MILLEETKMERFGKKLTFEEAGVIRKKLSRIKRIMHVGTTIYYDSIPAEEQEHELDLRFYIEYGLLPNEFLKNLLSNNILGIDSGNLQYIDNWIIYMRRFLPEKSYGSKKKFRHWMKNRNKVIFSYGLSYQSVYNYYLYRYRLECEERYKNGK